MNNDFTKKEIALGQVLDDIVHKNSSSLLGKFLTIIDSAIADTEQRKALKDIARQLTYSKDVFLYNSTVPEYTWIARDILNPELEKEYKEGKMPISDIHACILQFHKA